MQYHSVTGEDVTIPERIGKFAHFIPFCRVSILKKKTGTYVSVKESVIH